MSINQPPLVEDRIDNHGLIDPSKAKVPKHLESRTASAGIDLSQTENDKKGVEEIASVLPKKANELPKPLQQASHGKKNMDGMSFNNKISALGDNELELANKIDHPNRDVNIDTNIAVGTDGREKPEKAEA